MHISDRILFYTKKSIQYEKSNTANYIFIYFPVEYFSSMDILDLEQFLLYLNGSIATLFG
jgi:hypothetical protein